MKLTLKLAAPLDGLDLAAEGRFRLAGITALFGPSGAGKSSILAAIAGMRPGWGHVMVDGVTWQDEGSFVPAHQRPCALIFQRPRLFAHLDVAGQLRFGERRACRRGEPGFERVVEIFGLAPLLAQRPATLSGGQAQRVAIAQALMSRPRLLLMDEPFAGLDRQARQDVMTAVAAMPKEFGVHIVLVSHSLGEVVRLAETTIALHQGRFQGYGKTADMLGEMAPAITGRFEAGSVLTGRVARFDAATELTSVAIGRDTLFIPGALADAGAEVRVRVRARDVALATGPIEGLSIQNRLRAQIRSIRRESGAYAEIVLDTHGQILRARITRAAVSALALAPGQSVTALIKAVSFDRRLA